MTVSTLAMLTRPGRRRGPAVAGRLAPAGTVRPARRSPRPAFTRGRPGRRPSTRPRGRSRCRRRQRAVAPRSVVEPSTSGRLVRGPALVPAVAERLLDEHLDVSPIRSSARWAMSSSASSANSATRGATSSSSTLPRQAGRLGAVLVGVAEHADRVQPRRAQERSSSSTSSSVSPGNPTMKLERTPASGAARGSARAARGTARGRRTGASGAAPGRWRAGTTGRSRAPRRASSVITSSRPGRISAGCR